MHTAIQFNRNELSGAFGDIGTDLPLIIAMIFAAQLHVPSVLIVYGLLQIFTGIVYRMPMPVQPLKAMATIVIAQQIGGNVLLGAGLAIGVVMLFLSLTGLLDGLTRLVPKTVVRGIQLGLGISLCALSFKQYIAADGLFGYVLAAIAFLIILLFIDNKKFPASLLVIGLGVVYALVFKTDMHTLYTAFGINLPRFNLPAIDDVSKGFLLLALPQIPLSLGNSILATKQVSNDLFPARHDITVKKIGITYSLMNLVAPLAGGIPVCHGSGGMLGHYTFGGRTGGSVILYGLLFITLGLFFANGFANVIQVFPLPVLGVILLFEGISLMLLCKDMVADKRNFAIAIMVGVIAFAVQYGFVIALVVGTLLYYSRVRLSSLTDVGQQTAAPVVDNPSSKKVFAEGQEQ